MLFLEGVGGGETFVLGGDVAAHVETLHFEGEGAVRRCWVGGWCVVWVWLWGI